MRIFKNDLINFFLTSPPPEGRGFLFQRAFSDSKRQA